MSDWKSFFYSKTLIAFSSLLLSSASYASEKPVVISGFDDVLRQAENTGIFKAAMKLLEDDLTFSSMPILYTQLSLGRTDPKFYLVSAISHWFDGRIDRFLRTTQFPSNRRYLRNWLTQWSIEDFKIEKIKKIIEENPNQKFIVIFDNSDPSIVLAQTLNEKFPNQIETIYLHQITKKDIPQNALGYYTAFDIALHEYANQRLTLDEAQIVGQTILTENNVKQLFPSYAVCPTKYDPCNGVASEIEGLCGQVRRHIQGLCDN